MLNILKQGNNWIGGHVCQRIQDTRFRIFWIGVIYVFLLLFLTYLLQYFDTIFAFLMGIIFTLCFELYLLIKHVASDEQYEEVRTKIVTEEQKYFSQPNKSSLKPSRVHKISQFRRQPRRSITSPIGGLNKFEKMFKDEETQNLLVENSKYPTKNERLELKKADNEPLSSPEDLLLPLNQVETEENPFKIGKSAETPQFSKSFEHVRNEKLGESPFSKKNLSSKFNLKGRNTDSEEEDYIHSNIIQAHLPEGIKLAKSGKLYTQMRENTANEITTGYFGIAPIAPSYDPIGENMNKNPKLIKEIETKMEANMQEVAKSVGIMQKFFIGWSDSEKILGKKMKLTGKRTSLLSNKTLGLFKVGMQYDSFPIDIPQFKREIKTKIGNWKIFRNALCYFGELHLESHQFLLQGICGNITAIQTESQEGFKRIKAQILDCNRRLAKARESVEKSRLKYEQSSKNLSTSLAAFEEATKTFKPYEIIAKLEMKSKIAKKEMEDLSALISDSIETMNEIDVEQEEISENRRSEVNSWYIRKTEVMKCSFLSFSTLYGDSAADALHLCGQLKANESNIQKLYNSLKQKLSAEEMQKLDESPNSPNKRELSGSQTDQPKQRKTWIQKLEGLFSNKEKNPRNASAIGLHSTGHEITIASPDVFMTEMNTKVGNLEGEGGGNSPYETFPSVESEEYFVSSNLETEHRESLLGWFPNLNQSMHIPKEDETSIPKVPPLSIGKLNLLQSPEKTYTNTPKGTSIVLNKTQNIGPHPKQHPVITLSQTFQQDITRLEIKINEMTRKYQEQLILRRKSVKRMKEMMHIIDIVRLQHRSFGADIEKLCDASEIYDENPDIKGLWGELMKNYREIGRCYTIFANSLSDFHTKSTKLESTSQLYKLVNNQGQATTKIIKDILSQYHRVNEDSSESLSSRARTKSLFSSRKEDVSDPNDKADLLRKKVIFEFEIFEPKMKELFIHLTAIENDEIYLSFLCRKIIVKHLEGFWKRITKITPMIAKLVEKLEKIDVKEEKAREDPRGIMDYTNPELEIKEGKSVNIEANFTLFNEESSDSSIRERFSDDADAAVPDIEGEYLESEQSGLNYSLANLSYLGGNSPNSSKQRSGPIKTEPDFPKGYSPPHSPKKGFLSSKNINDIIKEEKDLEPVDIDIISMNSDKLEENVVEPNEPNIISVHGIQSSASPRYGERFQITPISMGKDNLKYNLINRSNLQLERDKQRSLSDYKHSKGSSADFTRHNKHKKSKLNSSFVACRDSSFDSSRLNDSFTADAKDLYTMATKPPPLISTPVIKPSNKGRKDEIVNESAVWFTRLFKTWYKAWSQTPYFGRAIGDLLENIYNADRPNYLGKIGIPSIQIGGKPPELRRVYNIPTQNPDDFLADADISIRGLIKLQLTCDIYINWPREKAAIIPLNCSVLIKKLLGRIRVFYTPIENARSWYGFVGQPALKFTIDPVFGNTNKIYLNMIPQVTGFLTDRLSTRIRKYVLPNTNDITIPFIPDKKDKKNLGEE